MALTGIPLLFLLVQHQTPQIKQNGSLLSNIVHLANDLMLHEHASVIDFWFFKSSNSSFAAEFVDILIATEPFAKQSKVLLDERTPDVEINRAPALVIVCFGWYQEFLTWRSIFSALFVKFSVQTKFVVIIPYTSEEYCSTVSRHFINVRLYNVFYAVLYVENGSSFMFNHITASDREQYFAQFYSLEQAYPDQLDLAGLTVVSYTQHSILFAYYNQYTGEQGGVDVQLVNTVIAHMNGTSQIEFVECKKGEDRLSCHFRKLNSLRGAFNFGRWILHEADYGVAVMPFNTLVILVPRGRPLTVFEILVAPFNVCTWLLVICVTLLDTIFEQRFAASRNQTIAKLVGISLIWFAFFVTSAYEAKLTSFLTSWAHKPDIIAIAELQSEGLKVATDYEISDSMIADPRLRGLWVELKLSSLESFLEVNSETALLMQYDTARFLLRKKANFDYINNRAKYVMLEERLLSHLSFFYFGFRSPLRVRFDELQRRVFEAGIYNHWMEMQNFKFQKPLASLEQDKIYIKTDHLWPLWKLFVFMWFACIITFGTELLYYRWHRLIHNRRNRRVGDLVRPRGNTGIRKHPESNYTVQKNTTQRSCSDSHY